MIRFKTLSRHNAIGVLFAILCTSLLVWIQRLTEPQIKKQAVAQQRTLLNQLLPATDYDNDLLRSCYQVQDPLLGSQQPQHLYIAYRQGKQVAKLITSEAAGYAGPIRLLIGSDLQGTILGVRVIMHQETPGLGDKIECRRSAWIQTFTGKKYLDNPDHRWDVRNQGGDFDQLSGATITSRAVIRRVEQTLQYLTQQPPHLLGSLPCSEEP
jgi:Na+-translocating ferredoxin:NAD+ oxidoreductase subunit G